MEITIFKTPVDGLIDVTVSLHEYTDDKGTSVNVTVWVPDHDSKKVVEEAALVAAIDQLKRALSVLENEDH